MRWGSCPVLLRNALIGHEVSGAHAHVCPRALCLGGAA